MAAARESKGVAAARESKGVAAARESKGVAAVVRVCRAAAAGMRERPAARVRVALAMARSRV
ncbi:hypothetical protein Rmf_48070 [Roseomonas fluvialis]|uniref:Uncharacterized protein n=1 Tax=Roseomonas fluvialis TaxID=1750527 RepID=A0ABM7Y9W1_9PROT|nr:hypothetical protein Rmf_48070 [Roseomonas fluvialis]